MSTWFLQTLNVICPIFHVTLRGWDVRKPCHVIHVSPAPCGADPWGSYSLVGPFFTVFWCETPGGPVDPATEDGRSVGVWSLKVPRSVITRPSQFHIQLPWPKFWSTIVFQGTNKSHHLKGKHFFNQPLWEGTCYLPERQVFNSWHVQLMFKNFTMTMAQHNIQHGIFVFSGVQNQCIQQNKHNKLAL